MTHFSRVCARGLFVTVALTATAHADPIEMEWSTIDAGGSLSYGGTLVLTGTIGQHDTSVVAAMNIDAGNGFWAEQDARTCPADFNADGFLDFTDFDYFVTIFEAGNPASDFNGDNFLDFTDFDAFVEAFESNC